MDVQRRDGLRWLSPHQRRPVLEPIPNPLPRPASDSVLKDTRGALDGDHGWQRDAAFQQSLRQPNRTEGRGVVERGFAWKGEDDGHCGREGYDSFSSLTRTKTDQARRGALRRYRSFHRRPRERASRRISWIAPAYNPSQSGVAPQKLIKTFGYHDWVIFDDVGLFYSPS